MIQWIVIQFDAEVLPPAGINLSKNLSEADDSPVLLPPRSTFV